MSTTENTKLCDFSNTDNNDFISTPIALPATSAESYDIEAALLNLERKEPPKRSFNKIATDNTHEEILENHVYNDPPSNKEAPSVLHTKRFHVGSGDIIGKSVIQEFFTCAGTIPVLGGSILAKTTSYVDAIILLVVELERKFIHMHPAIQRLFLELPNVRDPKIKCMVTIFLVHEFGFIMKEVVEIFAYYGVNRECSPIKEVLYDQDVIRKLKSIDYEAYDENLRKKVPPHVLVDKFFDHINDKFAVGNVGLNYELEKQIFKHLYRNLYNEELAITYEGPKEESPPPKIDLMNVEPTKYNPFNYLCLPIRKLVAEQREYERNINDLAFDRMP